MPGLRILAGLKRTAGLKGRLPLPAEVAQEAKTVHPI
jgi:hypothetical protein